MRGTDAVPLRGLGRGFGSGLARKGCAMKLGKGSSIVLGTPLNHVVLVLLGFFSVSSPLSPSISN